MYGDNFFGQELVPIKDIRLTWASLPDISAEKAQVIWRLAEDFGEQPTMEFFKREVIMLQGANLPGFGKGIAEKARRWLYGD